MLLEESADYSIAEAIAVWPNSGSASWRPGMGTAKALGMAARGIYAES
jgi:hypothetical protein